MPRPVTLSQWLECIDLPIEKCNGYRIRHGLPPLTQSDIDSKRNLEWDPTQPNRGLGDLIAKVTSAVGLKPCEGCKKRQHALNQMIPFQQTKAETPQKISE